MNAVLIVALLVAAAGEKPAPKRDASDAVIDLLNACIDAGGMRVVRDAKTSAVVRDGKLGIPLLEVTDCSKVRRAVAARRKELAMLRNSLIGFAKLAEARGAPALIYLLRVVGEESDDRVARQIAAQLAAGAGLPRQTPRGTEALRPLVNACIEDGCLRFEPDRAAGGGRLVAGDPARVRRILAERRAALTEESLDTAAALSAGKMDHSAFLRIAGEVAGDRRAQAFASLYAGRARQREGDSPEAVRLLEDAATRFGAIHETPWEAQALSSLGRLYQDSQELDRAAAAYRKARHLFETAYGRKHRYVGLMLYNLATVHYNRREMQSALFYLTQALPIVESAGKPGDAADCISLMGGIDFALGHAEDARENLLKALVVYRETHGEGSEEVADCHSSLGHVYLDLKDHGRARHHFDRALELRTDRHGTRHVKVAKSLLDLSSAVRLTGEYGLAKYTARQAASIFVRNHGPRDPRVSLATVFVAEVYRKQGEPERALGFMDAALDALLIEGRQNTPAGKRGVDDYRPGDGLVSVLRHKAELLEDVAGRQKDAKAQADRIREALRTYELAAQALERARGRAAGHDDRIQTVARTHFIFSRQIGIRRRLFESTRDPAHLRAAFEAAEQGTARTLLDELGDPIAQALARVSPELGSRQAQTLLRLRAADRAYAAEMGRQDDKRDPDRILALWADRKKIDGELSEVKKQIEKQVPQYAALRNPRPCSLAEARAALADNEVALLYVLGSPRSYLVLVEGRPAEGDKTEGLAVVELPDEAEIAGAVIPLKDSDPLSQPARVRALGAAAYEMLLGPLAERLRGKDLVVVPGGDLSFLPFELLQEPAGDEPDAGRFLVEGRRVRYAPSLTALHLLGQWKKTRPAPDRGLWALADPIYDDKDARSRGRGRTRVGGTFPRLPHTEAEVRAIAKVLGAGGATVLVGDDATEANVRKASASGELARARYVHFATHGILGVGTGRQPGLVLGHVGGDAEPGGEDGFLDMEEVLGLRLNADLVVLSACRSYAGAMHNGEGVRGLSRAFLCAGSRGVVCSLWAVDDRATAEFMAEFYGRLARGATAADALCRTKRAMIRRGKLPLHWAAFVLVGE